jgi:hypothetical protein
VWAPSKLYEQALPASVRTAMADRLREQGQRSFWEPPEDATPEQIAEFEALQAKMLVPDEQITTWIDVSGAPLQAKWDAVHEHVTQIAADSPIMLLGLDGWREGWGREAFILRQTRIDTDLPETDLFAGIA